MDFAVNSKMIETILYALAPSLGFLISRFSGSLFSS